MLYRMEIIHVRAVQYAHFAVSVVQ